MWSLVRTETFVRTARRFLRRRPHLVPLVGSVLVQLEADPFHPKLHTHGLSGSLEGLHAARVTYSVRIIMRIDQQEREVMLLDIGEHDQVY